MDWTVWDDDELVAKLTAPTAVGAARAALLGAYQETLAAPPRLVADAGAATLVFTAGGTDEVTGFRCYGRWPGESDQIVAVWGADGRLRGLVVGSALGALRTGALGAVAVDALARQDATSIAVIGAGRQAWTQLWAIQAVRPLADVRVASRTPGRTASFAERAGTELGLPARAVGTVAEAVRDADVVVLATRATEPVLDTDDLAPGTHVSSIGPRWRDGAEIPADLLDRADLVASDSPWQLATDPDMLTNGHDVRPLGAVLAGAERGRRGPADLTVYCSAGLAGSEVLLAHAAFDAR